jgi:hypothetical protein
MADAFYDEGRNGMLGGGVHAQPDLDTNDIRVGLRDEGVTAINLATQIDLADVTSAHVGTDTALAGLTVGTAGVGAFDHSDETYPNLSGATVESLDYYDFQTAVDATSPLIVNIDSWTGLPLTPNGGDVILAPHVNGVFVIPAA